MLLFTDVVESTALKQGLGDKAGLELLHPQHELVRNALSRFPDARESIPPATRSLFRFLPPLRR